MLGSVCIRPASRWRTPKLDTQISASYWRVMCFSLTKTRQRVKRRPCLIDSELQLCQPFIQRIRTVTFTSSGAKEISGAFLFPPVHRPQDLTEIVRHQAAFYHSNVRDTFCRQETRKGMPSLVTWSH
jgi:hypothetical protein